MIHQDCERCRVLGEFEDRVRDVFRHSPAEFIQITAALYESVEAVMRGHFAEHDREPVAVAKRKALAEKEIEVVGRGLWGYRAPDEHRTVIDGVKCGCYVCMDALVRKARETPVFTPEDAAAVDAVVKENVK